MDDLVSVFIIAAVSAGGTALLGGVQSFIKARVRSKTDIQAEEIKKLSELIVNEIKPIRESVQVLYKFNGPMVDGVVTLLEAAQGNCNGNVKRSLAGLNKAIEDQEKLMLGRV